MQLDQEVNRLENLLCKSFPPQRTYVLIIAWIIYHLFCLGVGKAELLGGEEGSVGTAKALLLCPESTARSPAAEHWCDSIDWPWQCPGVWRCMKGRGTAGYFALCSGGSVLGYPKAIHIISSTSAQLLCPNSAPEVHKTSLLFSLSPMRDSSCALLPHLVVLQMEVPPPITPYTMEPTVPSGSGCALRSPLPARGCACVWAKVTRWLLAWALNFCTRLRGRWIIWGLWEAWEYSSIPVSRLGGAATRGY